MILRNILFKSSALFLLLFPFFILTAAPAKAPQIRYTFDLGRKYLSLRDIASFYGLKFVLGQSACEITGNKLRASFVFDKRYGAVNGITVHYLNAIYKKGQEVFIAEQDFFSVLDPIVRSNSLKNQKIRTIMLDPGHGGKDNGAQGKKFKEKDVALDVARKLRDILTASGYKVIMTRETDVFPTLEDRTNKCNAARPDLFISIHCNGAGNPGINGVETFRMTPVGAASTSDSQAKFTRCPGNIFDNNNSRLAFEIQQSLARTTRQIDRGVKHARFYVIRNVICPAVLVEIGFITNPVEEMLLGNPTRQQTIAKSIAEGIKRYQAAISGSPIAAVPEQTQQPAPAAQTASDSTKKAPAGNNNGNNKTGNGQGTQSAQLPQPDTKKDPSPASPAPPSIPAPTPVPPSLPMPQDPKKSGSTASSQPAQAAKADVRDMIPQAKDD